MPPAQLAELNSLEAPVIRGDVMEQKRVAFLRLAAWWEQQRVFEPYAYYFAESAKLENSEKNLNFAAQLFLDTLRYEGNPSRRLWFAKQGKELFENLLRINPANDSAQVGLGSCYIFGNISDNPMEGILKIRQVAERDSTNVYAQFMLGMGGVVSGQLDKAIERFRAVLKLKPDHLEAMVRLAETYDRKGDSVNAIQWYQYCKKYSTSPGMTAEIDARILALKEKRP